MPLKTALLSFGIASLTLAAVALPAQAQDEPDMQDMRINCTLDYMRLCPGMNPAGAEVRSCFKRNRPNLSAACTAAINAYEHQKTAPDDPQ